LSLIYSKELHEIKPDAKLIDFALNHIKTYISKFPKNKKKLSIIIVITSKKKDVFDYVKDQLPDLEVIKVLFNTSYFEWAGSVYSAYKRFSENNLVLLPDSFLSLSDKNPYETNSGKTLIELCEESLKKSRVVFGYIKSLENKKLSNLGAMFVESNKILRFQDKPKKNFHLFNSYWGCYGFRKSVSFELYKFLSESIKKDTTDVKRQSFYPPFGFKIKSYIDLGTWESIDTFLLSESESSCSISGKT